MDKQLFLTMTYTYQAPVQRVVHAYLKKMRSRQDPSSKPVRVVSETPSSGGETIVFRVERALPKFVEAVFKIKSVGYVETAVLKGESMEVTTEQTIKNVTLKMTTVYADNGSGGTSVTGVLKAENVPKLIRKSTEKYIRSQFEAERRLEGGHIQR